jgi:hypothetical protein
MMGIVVLLEPLGILLDGIREPTGRDDHPALWAVEVERRDGRVEVLDDRPPAPNRVPCEPARP